MIQKMSQSDHTTNFHDYVIISVHIFLYFVSVAQFFAKLILSVAQFLYHKVFVRYKQLKGNCGGKQYLRRGMDFKKIKLFIYYFNHFRF